MNKLKEYTNGGFELNKPDYSIANIYFVLTCGGCPEQYDCYITDRGKKYQVGYVRLRWGGLSCDFPDVVGEIIFKHNFSDGFKGGFDNEKERVQYLALISMNIWDKLFEIGAFDD